MLQILTIARNTFVESIRQPVFFVIVMLCGILQFFNTWSTGFSLGYTESGEVSGDNKLLFDIGLATVFVCGTILAALTATAVISREIENRTVLTVVSKPIARPNLVLGKYLGVAGSLALALVPMILFLLMGLRHGVMSTAADDPDGPVLLFSFLAIGIALAVAVWCNFFYGWYFSQTCMLVLAPGMFLAYIGVLLVSKKWGWQPIVTDIKPQILFACIAMSLALFVLAAIATAVSTRLGQVMTITVCVGTFAFGLLSNFLIGRHVFSNDLVGIVEETSSDQTDTSWAPGNSYSIKIEGAARIPIKTGDSFFYSTTPSGFPMLTQDFPRFKGDAGHDALSTEVSPSLVITQISGPKLTVKRLGAGSFKSERPPQVGDFVFAKPTSISAPALILWGGVLNLHYFWLVDAISQNQLIPFSHMGLVMVYAFLQIIAFLALGVLLFQKRDVG